MANNWRNFCTKLWCVISSYEAELPQRFENNNVLLLPFIVFASRSCSHCETSLILESFPVSLYYKVNPLTQIQAMVSCRILQPNSIFWSFQLDTPCLLFYRLLSQIWTHLQICYNADMGFKGKVILFSCHKHWLLIMTRIWAVIVPFVFWSWYR